MDTIYPILKYTDENIPFYVTGIGCRANQEYINRPSGFIDYQWTFCRSGKGMFEVGGREYTIREKDAFFFRPNIPHKYYSVEEPWEVYWITFKGKSVETLMQYLEFGDYEVTALINTGYIDNLLERVCSLLKTGGEAYAQECSVLLYSFLLRMKALFRGASSKSQIYRSKRLEAIIEYIEKNYSKDIKLLELADLIGISASHLCRTFKQHYNMNVITYLTHYRIQKSKELMALHPDMESREIAEKVGFKDASYFCHIFRRTEGVTPTGFRGV